MATDHQAPKGTFDVLPADEAARAAITHATAAALGGAGYGRIETPIFEDTGLFERGVGESTDIVRKEMFTFDDQGGRSITLRPEGTAPICRAYIEHGMHRLPQPVKLWYQGPYFRYERPQEGRFRQFNQIGAEAIGSVSPLVDAELIVLLDRILRGLGIGELTLRLSSLGSSESRARYRDELREFLRDRESELSEDVRSRIDSNPMRAFDADDPGTRGVMTDAPRMLDRLDGEDAEHFAELRSLLDDAGVAYALDGTLVRGLDYYNRTVFEFDCSRLGAQSGVGGGGRYDGLVGMLGGKPTPAVGWAAGVERIMLAMESAPEPTGVDVFVVAAADDRASAFALVHELRDAGVAADLDLADRSTKGQMKQADRSGARHAVVLDGGGAVRIRDMGSGEERASSLEAVVAELTASAG